MLHPWNKLKGFFARLLICMTSYALVDFGMPRQKEDLVHLILLWKPSIFVGIVMAIGSQI
jgi:hypothetical protein